MTVAHAPAKQRFHGINPALGLPELWHYDSKRLTASHLQSVRARIRAEVLPRFRVDPGPP